MPIKVPLRTKISIKKLNNINKINRNENDKTSTGGPDYCEAPYYWQFCMPKFLILTRAPVIDG